MRWTRAPTSWALGLVAYYVLTGTHYWRAANTPDAPLTALLVEISADPIEAPCARAASQGRRLPEGFDEWFLRCVDRDLDRRYPDADAAWRALAGRLSGDAFAATLSSDALASALRLDRARHADPRAGRDAGAKCAAGGRRAAAQPRSDRARRRRAHAGIGGVAVGWSMQRGDPGPPPPSARVEASAPPDAGAAMAPVRPGLGAPSPSDAGPPDAGAREPGARARGGGGGSPAAAPQPGRSGRARSVRGARAALLPQLRGLAPAAGRPRPLPPVAQPGRARASDGRSSRARSARA
ncbi:MAG: hypothetical protein M5U28_15780 [Sandaracinaceae bacterium]|nr:hypothetical protein [Sandaracinaceae bacterium]